MRTVLIVGASGVLARSLGSSAEALGLTPVIVGCVSEAIEAIGGNLPCAIVASHELADMPGESLYAALHASPVHRVIPFAMMTTEARSPGGPFVMFTKSPSIGAAFRDWLEGLGLRKSHEADREELARDVLDGTRLLIAEDTASIRRLLAHRLHLRGAIVSLAEDGIEASVLGLAGRFDLIVLDIEMPRLDGRDAIRIFRDRGCAVSVVALTAHDDPCFVEELRSVDGFDAVISKQDPIAGIERFLLERADGIGNDAA